MPYLVLKGSGRQVFVAPEMFSDAVASGIYEAPAADQTTTVEVRPGLVGETTVGNLGATAAQGYAPESESTAARRQRTARLDREHGGIIEGGITLLENAADDATLGLFGAAADTIGGEEYAERRQDRIEARPNLATAGKVIGTVGTIAGSGGTGLLGKAAKATPLGAVTRLGSKIAKVGEEASLVTKIGRSAAGAGFEGAAQGLGAGIQQLTAMQDPVSIEQAASILSSNALYGGAMGAGVGAAGRVVEHTLAKAKGALDAARKGASSEIAVAEDLAGLDAKALNTARKVELDGIEAARVPQRAQLSEEITAFRREMKDQKVWLATKGAEDAEIRAIGKRTLKADKALDNLIDDPKYFAENPKGALSHLRKQEAALDELVTKHSDKLRATFAADTSGVRSAALDNAAKALERNRSLQAKITDLAALPSSSRLQAIDDAKEALLTGAQQKKGLVEQMAGAAVFGGVAGAVAGTDLPGASILAPILGAKAAGMLGQKLFGGFAKATSKVGERLSKATGAFLDVTRKVAPAAPVLATKILGGLAYAPKVEAKAVKGSPPSKPSTLASVYRARADEVRAQVTNGPAGVQMKPDARRKLGSNLAPIAATDPRLADQIETHAARRIEFLASKLPKRPDLGAVPTGPDQWQPSDMEMRTWARYAAAAEDPAGVAERLVDGSITPEDAETMRVVYPEMLAQLTQNVLEQLPELQATLPYQRRLALSILTGVPVDAAMHPRVLGFLQASFTDEPGSEGGTTAPKPMPQFGSVKNQEATASQQRQGATT